MKNLVDKVLRQATRLDSVVDAFVSGSLRGDRRLTPAELLAEIVAQVERGITLGPDGPVFPFNRIGVDLPASTPERESELRGAISPEAVRAAVISRLQRQVAVPDDLRIDLRITAGAETAPCTVTLRTAARRRAVPEPPIKVVARLVSADGSARFTLGEGIVNIGRVAEIQGRDGRMVRRNQIVLGSDAAGATVSRQHARILGTRAAGSVTFTLFDDGSQRGSTVVRGGRPHKVVQGPVGLRLQDGDELYFGKVRLLFRFRPGA
jgi:pSer/pThr/pTyr-binding forkhead associated (FHA) protein